MTFHDADQPHGSDPYRFGVPEPVPAQRPTGREILRSSRALMREDRRLLLLPLLGAFASAAAFAVLFVPGMVIGLETNRRPALWVGAVVGVFVASAVAIFFNAALVAAASMRADGTAPTLDTALAAAGRHWRTILSWTALTTTVGFVIRTVERRLGILGLLLGFLGGVAWGVASFFVVPAMIVEGLGPVESLRRSSAVIREVWGTSARTTLRFGVLQALLVIASTIAGFAGFSMVLSGGAARPVGVVVLAVAVLAFVAVAVVSAAIMTYARTLIFRYATGRPVPGLDPAVFSGAFRPRRRWGRR